MERSAKNERFKRAFAFERGAIDPEARTVEAAFSTETRDVRRWFGIEVLRHDPGSVDLVRMKSGALMLWNHDPDNYLGVVEADSVRIEDGKLRARVRFSDSPEADQKFRDIQNGILRSVSIGYEILSDPVLVNKGATAAEDEYEIRSWRPYEVSLVSIPADVHSGIGRTLDPEPSGSKNPAPAGATIPKGNDTMSQVQQQDPAPAGGGARVDDAGLSERLRIEAIDNLCRDYGIDDDVRKGWRDAGTSIPEATRKTLEIIKARSTTTDSVAHLGMSKKEVEAYSLNRALMAVCNKDWRKAGLELEASQEVAKRAGKQVQDTNFLVPADVSLRGNAVTLADRRMMIGRRDLTVGTPSAGGYLVGTDNISFIDLLRNRSVALRMGATRMTGLQGNVTVPKQIGTGAATWLANESATVAEVNQSFGQLPLSPKHVGAYTEISKQLAMQSAPSAEAIVWSDLAKVVALAADLAVLNGSGAAGQPTGILQTGSIGSVSGTTLGYAGILEFQSDVAANNVMPMAGGYATTPVVAALMMARQRFSSTDSPLWVGNLWDGVMAGFQAMSSNQLPSATMIFGDWAEAIWAEWNVLEIEVNPYAAFQQGLIGVRAWYSMDVGVRYAGAFSAANTIT